MTFEEIKNEDYSTRAYTYFVAMLATQGKLPIDIVRVDNADQTSIFVIMLENSKGNVNTKRIRLSTADAVYFTAYLSNDFPSVDYRHLDRTKTKGA